MPSDWDKAEPVESGSDGLPPHSIEAERGVLGCVLIDPACLGSCINRLKAGSSVFYDPKHRRIYEAMISLAEDSIAIDLISLKQELSDSLVLTECGGLTYLSGLPDATPGSSNLGHYLDIIVQKFALRSIIQSCYALSSKAQEGGNVVASLADAESLIASAVSQLSDVTTTRAVADLMPEAVARIEALHASQGAMQGVPTGFLDLDAMARGLKPGEVFVLAGRPASGKSALAMNIADHAAVTCGIPTGVLSLEMTSDSLMLRLLCARAKANSNRVMDGSCTEAEFTRLALASSAIAQAPLYIDDEGGITDLQLKAKARRMSQTYGIQLLIVDYLQLMHSAKRTHSRQEEVSTISAGVKLLAKELKIPIILVAQLNRDVEKGGNRRPRLSDLRESGAIEQDADMVGMLYSPKQSPSDDDEQTVFATVVHLLIAKHRNGPTGEVRLVFLKPLTKFESHGK